MKIKPFQVVAVLIIGSAPFLAPSSDRKPEPKPAPVIAKDVGDLSGIYYARGQQADGKTYTGVVILERKGDVYAAQWNTGGTTSLGVGVRQGESVSFGWALPGEKGVMRGVTVYKIQGKKLNGRWTSMPGPGVVMNETLEWLRALEDDE